jgi:glyceraldehyde 3-phosphate dehydrogenase
MRVAINGFGRIGRSVFRILDRRSDIQAVAVNDIAEADGLAYLLKYDTVMRRFPGKVVVRDGHLVTDHNTARLTSITSVEQLPWRDLGVDCVIEATGRFRKRAELERHLAAGARRVVLTVPAKDEIDFTIVIGVNEDKLRPEHCIISNASCTTNCLAPIAGILHKAFGIEKGLMTTVHAYTNDQRLADVPHSDFRRSRAAAENIIPTTTGAARAVGKVLPELNGKLDGMAMRVPVPDGSTVDLVTLMKKSVSVDEVNEVVLSASQTSRLSNIVQYSNSPIVSSDVIGNAHSAIFDSLATRVVAGNYVKTISWYDNEYGYSCRVVDLLALLKGLD